MLNRIKYYTLRYWISISFILLAIYFYQPSQTGSHCSPNVLLTGDSPKTLFGLSEMTLMWVVMAIAHSIHSCYCDVKLLFKKK